MRFLNSRSRNLVYINFYRNMALIVLILDKDKRYQRAICERTL